MNRLKIVLKLLILFLFASCIGKPEFEDTPAITFKSIENSYYETAKTDSVTIVVSFTDGDGDLGLGGSESNPPYNPVNPDGEPNKFAFNYFVDIYRVGNNGSSRVNFPDGATFSGRFLRLNNTGEDKALEGEIKYAFGIPIGIFNSPVNLGDSLYFEVQIADRRLRLSNKIETPGVRVGIIPTDDGSGE